MYITHIVRGCYLLESIEELDGEMQSYFMMILNQLEDIRKQDIVDESHPSQSEINSYNYKLEKLVKTIVMVLKKAESRVPDIDLNSLVSSLESNKNNTKQFAEKIVKSVKEDIKITSFNKLAKVYVDPIKRKQTKLFNLIKTQLMKNLNLTSKEKISEYQKQEIIDKTAEEICKVVAEDSKEKLNESLAISNTNSHKLFLETDNPSLLSDDELITSTARNRIIMLLSGCGYIFIAAMIFIAISSYYVEGAYYVITIRKIKQTLKKLAETKNTKHMVLVFVSFILFIIGIRIIYKSNIKPLLGYIKDFVQNRI